MNAGEWNERADWLQYGIEKRWVSDSFCLTHDGYMHTDEEWEKEAEEGDPCYVIIKILE